MTGMAYVGRKVCGCVCAAIVDDPAHKKEVAEDIADWIKSGLTIDRVSVEYVRENFVGWACPHEPKQLTLPITEETKHE